MARHECGRREQRQRQHLRRARGKVDPKRVPRPPGGRRDRASRDHREKRKHEHQIPLGLPRHEKRQGQDQRKKGQRKKQAPAPVVAQRRVHAHRIKKHERRILVHEQVPVKIDAEPHPRLPFVDGRGLPQQAAQPARENARRHGRDGGGKKQSQSIFRHHRAPKPRAAPERHGHRRQVSDERNREKRRDGMETQAAAPNRTEAPSQRGSPEAAQARSARRTPQVLNPMRKDVAAAKKNI